MGMHPCRHCGAILTVVNATYDQQPHKEWCPMELDAALEKAKTVEVVNAGHRERQALLAFWKKNFDISDSSAFRVPFWKFLEGTSYDPVYDVFSFSNDTEISVETCNQMKEE